MNGFLPQCTTRVVRELDSTLIVLVKRDLTCLVPRRRRTKDGFEEKTSAMHSAEAMYSDSHELRLGALCDLDNNNISPPANLITAPDTDQRSSLHLAYVASAQAANYHSPFLGNPAPRSRVVFQYPNTL